MNGYGSPLRLKTKVFYDGFNTNVSDELNDFLKTLSPDAEIVDIQFSHLSDSNLLAGQERVLLVYRDF